MASQTRTDWHRRGFLGGLAAAPFAGPAQAALDQEASALAAFLADDIGHGRSFSLDTDDALRERAAAVRAQARAKQGPRR